MGNIFNPKTKENTGYGLKEETTPVSPEKLIIAASGSLIVGGALKLVGRHKAASLISKFALPLLVLGCYRKFTSNSTI